MTAPSIGLAPWSSRGHAAGVRLTPRGRAALTALVPIALLIVVAVGLFRGEAAALGDRRPLPTDSAAVEGSQRSTQVHVVARGDTMWDIAARIAPGSDPRPVVDEIQRLNSKSDSRLALGERLRLPAGRAAS